MDNITSALIGFLASVRQEMMPGASWKFFLIDISLWMLCYEFGNMPLCWMGFFVGNMIFGIRDAIATYDPNDSALPSLESDDSKPLEDAPDRDVFQELIHANDPDYPCGETQEDKEKDS